MLIRKCSPSPPLHMDSIIFLLVLSIKRMTRLPPMFQLTASIKYLTPLGCFLSIPSQQYYLIRHICISDYSTYRLFAKLSYSYLLQPS